MVSIRRMTLSLSSCAGVWLSTAVAYVCRAQTSANCRLEGTCEIPLQQWPHNTHACPLLSFKRSAFCTATTDVHEQKKTWVPLMLQSSYRPTGWLGIMCVQSPNWAVTPRAHRVFGSYMRSHHNFRLQLTCFCLTK